MTAFVRSTDPIILDRFDEIVTCWLSALGETEESATGKYVFELESAGSPEVEPWSSDAAAVTQHAPSPPPSPTPSLGSAPTPTGPSWGGSVQAWDNWDDEMLADCDSEWPDLSPQSVLTSASSLLEDIKEDVDTKGGGHHVSGNDAWSSDSNAGDNDVPWAAKQTSTNADWCSSPFPAISNHTLLQTSPGLIDSADIYYNDDETAEPVERGWGDLSENTPAAQRITAVSCRPFCCGGQTLTYGCPTAR